MRKHCGLALLTMLHVVEKVTKARLRFAEEYRQTFSIRETHQLNLRIEPGKTLPRLEKIDGCKAAKEQWGKPSKLQSTNSYLKSIAEFYVSERGHAIIATRQMQEHFTLAFC